MEFMPPGAASTLVPAAAASSVSGVGAICDFKRKDIAFRSQGAVLRGYLYLPVDSGSGELPPVLVMTAGFSGTMHMGLLETAEALCTRTG